MRMVFAVGVLASLASCVGAIGNEQALFNGHDLSGWTNVNCAPSTWSVRDGMIISTGVPTGVMRTMRQYENFILDLDWRHMKEGGNAGVFVWSDAITSPGVPFTRSIEVQVLDGRNTEVSTSHGDLFSIHGAKMTPDRPHPKGWMRCLPSEWRAKSSPEWNHYQVLCSNGVVKLAVNGKVVSGGSNCSPRKGYICLESEGSEAHFRNINVRELPSTNPGVENVAREDESFRSLYTGVDLSGWKQEGKGRWTPKDWTLAYDGEPGEGMLWNAGEYSDFVLIVDCRVKGNRGEMLLPVKIQGAVPPSVKLDKDWNRAVLTLRGKSLSVTLNGKNVVKDAQLADLPVHRRFGLAGAAAGTEFANIYIRNLE